MLFALTAEESDYEYMKMNDGMVQPMKKDIVISLESFLFLRKV